MCFFYLKCWIMPVRYSIDAVKVYRIGAQPTFFFHPNLYKDSLLILSSNLAWFLRTYIIKCGEYGTSNNPESWLIFSSYYSISWVYFLYFFRFLPVPSKYFISSCFWFSRRSFLLLYFMISSCYHFFYMICLIS